MPSIKASGIFTDISFNSVRTSTDIGYIGITAWRCAGQQHVEHLLSRTSGLWLLLLPNWFRNLNSVSVSLSASGTLVVSTRRLVHQSQENVRGGIGVSARLEFFSPAVSKDTTWVERS